MGLPNKGMLLVGAPLERKQDPRNVVDGQFSGPFVVACALVHGHFGWDSYGRMEEAPLREMMRRITCVEDSEVQAEFPANMSGKLTIRARGQEFSRMVVVPKGEPGNFLSEAELRAKFHGLADAVLGEQGAQRLANAVLGLAGAGDMHELLRLGVPRLEARLAGE